MPRFYYGGQAVLEGVMMRGRAQATVAVRRRDGSIVTRTELLPSALYSRPAARLPLARGLVALWEMLVLGLRMLFFSANVQAEADLGQEIPRGLMASMLAFSLTMAVLVFFVLPLVVTRAGGPIGGGALAGNLVEGGIRLALFLLYLTLIGRLERVRRLFQYHGAEHKAVNAFEHGAPLTPASVQRYSTIHVRCGTAFLLWIVVISILIFAALGHPPFLVGVLERIVLVPVVAAVSYEVLRLGARFYAVTPVRMLLQPGLWLQRLTTREPTDDQVEVAIAALLPVLAADGALASEPVPAGAYQTSQVSP